MATFLKIHPDNPQERLLRQAVDELQRGGVVIYPTDTLYALGCSILQPRAIERIARMKQVDPAKAQFSFICNDLSDLSQYARQIGTPTFRLLKQYLPGPYTFILPASKLVPRILQNRKSTIGLRVPDHAIVQEMVSMLGHPLLSASLPGDEVEDYTDPELMRENFDHLVDVIIDGGTGGTEPSTVVDLTGDEPELIREGKGAWP